MDMDRRVFSRVARGGGGEPSLGQVASAQGRRRLPQANNVVLVHGLFADGSSWSEVIPLLQARGLERDLGPEPADDAGRGGRSLPQGARPAGWADGAGGPFLLGHDRDRGWRPSECLGARLCGGAGARCRGGLCRPRRPLSRRRPRRQESSMTATRAGSPRRPSCETSRAICPRPEPACSSPCSSHSGKRS